VVESIKTAVQGSVWLRAKVRDCGIGLQPRLYTYPVCGDSTAEAAFLAIVALP